MLNNKQIEIRAFVSIATTIRAEHDHHA
ncbi:MAG: hypothetical protein QG672_299, partial [Pseudomonadota bacterium]|nr:hypothetical protein [Pseudomonadota bacterium]